MEEQFVRITEWIQRHLNEPVRLRLATPSDAAEILSLRLNESLNKHLSSVENDIDAQKKWLERYSMRERLGQEFYFVIEFREAFAGTVRIYDMNEQSFCWGSWIIKPGFPANIALRTVKLVYDIGKNVLGFDFCHFDVRKANRSVWRFHERMGAKRQSEDELNVYYIISTGDAETAAEGW